MNIEIKMQDNNSSVSLGKYWLDDKSSLLPLENLVNITLQAFQTKVAAFTIQEEDGQLFKVISGCDFEDIPREDSIFNITIESKDVLIVEDLLGDERFKNSPLVLKDPKIRFYAGSRVLTNDGVPIGCICILDTVPRIISSEEVALLKDVASLASHVLETNINRKSLENLNSRINKLSHFVSVCYKCKSLKTESGEWELLENYLDREFNVKISHSICESCTET